MRKMNFVLSVVLICLLAGCSTAGGLGVAVNPPHPIQQEQSVQADASAQAGDSVQSGDAVQAGASAQFRDFASELRLDMESDTLKQEVTVKTYIDGDTTHFLVPRSVSGSGVLKARYLAVDAPESTGKIEEYGKKASAFTKERLSRAVSIVIESDNGTWNLDSTGGRHLVWVWYKESEGAEYRNLNIELLENGLAIASASASNRYGAVCMAAIAQAKALKLNVYSGEKDPDFYYGEAVELTLKELRCNIEQYRDKKVAFEGVITKNDGSGVYVEEHDPETDMYNGIYVYYGYNLPGAGLDILSVGNRSRIVGSLQYYEAGGVYQISGLSYKLMKPRDPGNIQLISSGHKGAYALTDPSMLASGKVAVQTEDGTKEFDYAYLALDTTVEVDNLLVKDIRTVSREDSSSYGAMTMLCEAGGVEVRVRTSVLVDENRNIITKDVYEHRCINVRGLIGFHDGLYQIKVLSEKDITINY